MAGKHNDLTAIAWPVFRLGELIETLARRAGYLSYPGNLPQPLESSWRSGDETLGRWVDAAAGTLGLEAEAVDVLYLEVENLLRSAAPAILRLPGALERDAPRFIGLLKGGKNWVRIIAPDLRIRRVSVSFLLTTICSPYETEIGPHVDQLLADAEVPSERQKHVRRAILNEQLGPLRLEGGWLLRLSPGAKLGKQLRDVGFYRPVTILLSMYLLQQALALLSWFVIGRGIFQGNFDWAWLMAWILLLFAAIPVQLIVGDAQGELAMNAGAIFKQRLLHGTLKLDPEEIRHQGMGQFLGRVMESEAVEMLAFGGGFMALLSFIELGLAGWILSKGANGLFSVASLGSWVLVTLFFLWRYYRASRAWAEIYRGMTNDLVERLVGHRTRLAQEDPQHWHDEEDQSLDRYIEYSLDMDRMGVQLGAVVLRGWMFLGLLGVALAFVTGAASIQQLAISLGGVLFASQALGKLTGGAQSLVSLVIAWQQVGPLYHAAARQTELPSLEFVSVAAGAGDGAENQARPAGGQPLLVGRDLVFRYRPLGRPVIDDCSLQINQGDRVLLEGSSGGGKSTLAALLTGLRFPEAGSLLLWGFDRQILGVPEWRRRVVMAPQFQENYVFSDTLAFNLLMGRRWPPRPQDLQEAENVCRELGLGDVLDRMPSGFQQMLGESGWQLSHGERSRLYIARTLLQNADLIILDESFGALDPENLYRSLSCVLNRAPTLLVIAHP